MATDNVMTVDPFSDGAEIVSERALVAESTLSVGRNATLTLGTDSLIVLGMPLSLQYVDSLTKDR